METRHIERHLKIIRIFLLIHRHEQSCLPLCILVIQINVNYVFRESAFTSLDMQYTLLSLILYRKSRTKLNDIETK